MDGGGRWNPPDWRPGVSGLTAADADAARTRHVQVKPAAVTTPLAEPLRIGWALCAGLAFRFAFSVYDVPQGALMAAATVGDAARSRVATTRNFGSGLAVLLVVVRQRRAAAHA